MSGADEQHKAEAEPKRRPANENPWYLLATLYGEQPEGHTFDSTLHGKNHHAWNRYMAGRLEKQKLAELRGLKDSDGAPRFSPEQLKPLTEEELTAVGEHYRARGGGGGGGDLPTGTVDFSETAFKRPFRAVDFIFPAKADFTNAVFSAEANFARAAFLDLADFEHTSFRDWTDFTEATFSSAAKFTRATFSAEAHFVHATFSDCAYFDRAAYLGRADFKRATFSSQTLFVHAAFSGRAFFPHAKFSSEVIFAHAIFSNSVFFSHATFDDRSYFKDVKFLGPTFFAYATFSHYPPAFHHAVMREDTQWHGVKWPPIPVEPTVAQEHLYNYERLKQEMERLKKHEDEQFFFSKELQCREVIDGFPRNLVSKAYRWTSFYGRSIKRPLYGLGFAWLAGFLLLWPFGRTCLRGLKFTEAFGLSFYNLFPFLPYRKEVYAQGFLDALSRLAHVVAAGQAFAGAILLFLLGLALRNRFRMK